MFFPPLFYLTFYEHSLYRPAVLFYYFSLFPVLDPLLLLIDFAGGICQ